MQIKYVIEERLPKGKCLVANEFVPAGTLIWQVNPDTTVSFSNQGELEEYWKDKSTEERE